MDVELFTITEKNSTVIRLEKWQDWPLWFDQLKIWCKRNDIWDDVNPEHLMGKKSERAKLKLLFEQVKPTIVSIKPT
ncbi:hypothetical protein HI914_06313 [Erysiphe necator]|nr:hypothetical protein HI914_06313 [Erysiphe necator]